MKTIASFCLPAGKRAKLSIVIYHRVLPEADHFLGDGSNINSFNRQLCYLTRNFNVLSLSEAVEHLRAATLPARAVCITFDDGYADNADIALPILEKHGVAATFFVATGFLNGGRMWNDTVIESFRRAQGNTIDLREIGLECYTVATLEQRREALFSVIDKLKYLEPVIRQSQVDKLAQIIAATLPDDLMMTSDQVKLLHDHGMEIGGHTVNHPILASTDETTARTEIAQGKAHLETITGAPVRFFAYPNGKPGRDYLPIHVDIIRQLGFEAAVSTAWGAACHDDDLFQLPRFTPWDRKEWAYVLRMVRNRYQQIQTA